MDLRAYNNEVRVDLSRPGELADSVRDRALFNLFVATGLRVSEMHQLDDEARHSGKSYGVLCQGAEVKYALIRRNRRQWPIGVQCRMLGVSVAGYHEHFLRCLQIARRRHLSAEAQVVHIRASMQPIAGHTGGRASGENFTPRASARANSVYND
jgi:site-specific recombinase XerC